MPPLRIAVLCADGPSDRALVAALSARWPLVAIAVEPYAAQVRGLRRRGCWTAWGWAVYHVWRRRITGMDRRRRRHFRDVIGSAAMPPHLVTADINGGDVVRLLEAQRPDITIVRGASILKPAVLGAAGDCVINLHGGTLPEYRGNHCIFFAWLHRRLDCIGATIHFVNNGVDTGDIIDVVGLGTDVDLEAASPEDLYCLSVLRALTRLTELIASMEAGRAIPRRPQDLNTGCTYRTRDRRPIHELQLLARTLLGKRSPAGKECAS